MDPKSWQTLELPKILERLAGYTAFSASAELARALTPTASLHEARRRLEETREARRLLALHPETSVGGARDVRPLARAAARGVVLEPTDLLDIKATLVSARSLRRRLENLAGDLPNLARLAEGLAVLPDLVEAISWALDDRGEVLDSASERLAAIRRDLAAARERLLDRLQRLISDPAVAPLLQEPIVTQREGRYVVPLKAEFKGRLKAVVHDQSSSGATLFVEPLQVVDLNNRVRELELAERDEIRRVLADLSARVSGQSEALVATVEALAALDLALAKARYAEALEASEPRLRPFRPRQDPPHPGSTLRLRQARHPLLDPATVVPVDLVLDDETYALVITGPNTGGKTVTLKTAGLLALMAQCGLHLPVAEGSELSVFDGVYADIGDEQSIEQSLSTFSSHIANIVRLLEQADERSLVLLDELGAGTDPQEGAALARAILGTLLDRRVTTLVATHYPELKAYAHLTPGVRNASVEFDLESLRPTYRLTIGLPGRSNALAIAERLGLDPAIIERARRHLTPEDLQAESLLAEIHRLRDEARRERQVAEAARREAERLREELEARLARIEEERAALLAEAREQVEAELEALRQEIRRLRRRLAAAAQPLEALQEIEREVEALEDQAALPEPEPLRPERERTFRPGDRVMVGRLGVEGVLLEVGEEQAEVQVGRLRLRARLEDLAPPDRAPAPAPAGPAPSPSPAAPPAPPLEIDLRGQTVDEALEALERHLDAAYLAGLPFLRVIHGKGTGRLREAVRQALRGNPYVRSFEPGGPAEGGDGVTVVRLATD